MSWWEPRTDVPLHEWRPSAFEMLPAALPEARRVHDRIWVSTGLSHSWLITTDDGRVIVNTGMGFESPVHKRNFDAVDDSPTRAIIFTQAHPDHVGGADHFREDGTELIAQAGNAEHLEQDARIAAYRQHRSDFAFADTVRDGAIRILKEFGGLPDQASPTPTITFDDRYELTVGGVDLELLATPGGETFESLVVWLPRERVAICGNLFSALTGHIPNLVTLRGDRYRNPLQFIESLERVRALGAEMLLVSTSIDKVAINYRQPNQRDLDRMTVTEAREYMAAGHFAPGSMRPKIRAAIEFLEQGGKKVIITQPHLMEEALHGRAGTHIVP